VKTIETDEELLSRQAALQAEADAVVADLDLLALLGQFGRPVRVGSSVLGLMVVRDIDVTTLCPSLDPVVLFEAARPLVSHPRVRELTFRNDTGHWNTSPHYPDGIYWLVRYVADSGAAWTLDLWFIPEGTTQWDIEHVASLPPRLTSETRAAILRIKAARPAPVAPARIPSYEIYVAVLDHGVRTPDEFIWHLERGSS
jgi:hypothetical protein